MLYRTLKRMIERGQTAGMLDGMDDKLDALTETAQALADKPAKRWDGLVDKLIYAAALAVVAWLSAGMPGLN